MIIDRTPATPNKDLATALDLLHNVTTWEELMPHIDEVLEAMERNMKVVRHRMQNRRKTNQAISTCQSVRSKLVIFMIKRIRILQKDYVQRQADTDFSCI
jgi:hypothetical protein